MCRQSSSGSPIATAIRPSDSSSAASRRSPTTRRSRGGAPSSNSSRATQRVPLPQAPGLAAVRIEEAQPGVGLGVALDQQQLVEADPAVPVADPPHGGSVQRDGRTPSVQHDEVVAAAVHLDERNGLHAPGG